MEQVPVEEASLLASADVAQQQLDFELAVLKSLPGASSVTDFPPGGVASLVPNDLQKNGVRLKVDGRLVKQTFNQNITDKVAAARALKEKIKGAQYCGAAAVLAAEDMVRTRAGPQQPSAPAELTEAISPHQRDARTMILAPGVTLTHPGLIPQTIISSLVVANDFAENGSIIFPSSDLQTNRVLAVHQADCSGAPVYGVEMQLRTATVACPPNNSAVIHESSVEEAL